MSQRSIKVAIASLACLATAIVPAASASAYSSVGAPAQIAWVRHSASNFVGDELAGSGAGVCSILGAHLQDNDRHETCTQRWNARLTDLLHEPGARARLHAEARAIASARVVVHGTNASIQLPESLLGGKSQSAQDRFRFTDSCWMLEG